MRQQYVWKTKEALNQISKYAKAFNLLLLKILVKKAECLNFLSPQLNNYKIFFRRLIHCFKISDVGINFPESWCTHGTILARFLFFLLYVNDFWQQIKGNVELVQFAVDASILIWYDSGKNIATIEKFYCRKTVTVGVP